jgi:hypothetical protein
LEPLKSIVHQEATFSLGIVFLIYITWPERKIKNVATVLFVARLCKYISYVKATKLSLCTFVNLFVAVKNTKMFNVAMEMQQ